MPSKEYILRAGEGEFVQVAALGVRFKIGGENTDGRFALVEHPLPGRALGSPMHTHHNEGGVLVRARGAVRDPDRGRGVRSRPRGPRAQARGIPHAFWNAGDEPARLLELISPAGFGNYFRELAPLRADPQRNAAAIAELRARFGLDMDLASAPIFAERYGLRPG